MSVSYAQFDPLDQCASSNGGFTTEEEIAWKSAISSRRAKDQRNERAPIEPLLTPISREVPGGQEHNVMQGGQSLSEIVARIWTARIESVFDLIILIIILCALRALATGILDLFHAHGNDGSFCRACGGVI